MRQTLYSKDDIGRKLTSWTGFGKVGFVLRACSIAIVSAGVILLAASPASAAPAFDEAFDIPDGVGSNNEIVQGPDGNMWVTRESANGVARIEPDGTVTPFPLANSAFGITVGPDDNLWVSTAIGVAKIPPEDPSQAESFSLSGFQSGRGITTGQDGKLWVAGEDNLASFTTADPEGSADLNPITGMSARGMDTGTDGLLWIADASGRILSATAADTPTVTEYDVGGGPQDVGAGPGGQVVYANPLTNPQTVGLISPGGDPEPIELENTDPFGVVFGQDGAYWIPRAQGNDMLRLTTGGASTTLTGFPDSGGVGPRKVATGPGNTLWVTLDTPDQVARVTGVTAAKAKAKIDKAPPKKVKTKKRKAKVKFKFSSPTEGAKFECSLEKRSGKPKFDSCRSPESYELKPGDYEFQVRAKVGGETGKPDTAKFEVVRKG